MKNKKSVIILLMIAGILAYVIYWVFFNWSRFKEELIIESTSPDGTYTINAYLNNSNKRPKKIYWDKAEKADILWIDENTVEINGIRINLPNESYDFRKVIH